MPLLRRRTQSATTTQPAGGAVPGQRATPESAQSPEPAGYSQGEGAGAARTGDPAASAEYRQTGGRHAGAQAYGEPAESRTGTRRHYYGMAGTLMILSGMLVQLG